MRKILGALALASCLAGAAQTSAMAQGQPQRTPIEAYASDPMFSSAAISPDGRYVVGIRTTGDTDALIRLDWRTNQAVVIQQVQRGEVENQIDWVEWKGNDRLIMSVSTTRPATLRENRGAHIRSAEEVDIRVARIVAMNPDGSNLTPMFEGQTRNLAYGPATTALADTLHNDPDHVLLAALGANGFALFRANVRTGQTQRVEEGGWDGQGWGLDGVGNAVLRFEGLRGGEGYRVFRRAPGESRWTEFRTVRGGAEVAAPEFVYMRPGPGPGLVWVAARPDGANVAGLYLLNTATGEYGQPQYQHERADFLGDIWISRDNTRLMAACVRYQRRECQFFDQQVGRHIRAVDAFFDRAADVTLVDMSDDANTWLLYVQGPTTAPSYYIYNVAETAVLPVSATMAGIVEARMAPMTVVSYQGRDGTALWGYLTSPVGGPTTNAPLVVLPHGGPEARDTYGYNPIVQFLASRGYMVFQPQFRGSGGFGQAFADAGRRQWGQTMQHDVTDGVRHLIASGQVDANRICIVGISYGGYAALAGAALTPDLYRCAISINGVADLREMLRWEAIEGGRRSAALDYWRRSIGHRDEDRAMLDAASPLQQVNAIRIPILLVAGEQDWIVPVEQSREMRNALQRAGRPVRYLEVPQGGHSPYSWRIEQRVQFFREMESFLATHLN